MDRRPRRVARLAALLCLGLAALAPHTSGHPFHLLIENAILVNSEQVYDTRWVGQSFTPAADFVATRIALYVEDRGGSEPLSVWVRDCCLFGFPGSTTLASGAADGPALPGWLDVDLVPSLPLAAGQTYWIVAHSNGNNANQGYDWWSSADDLAYGPGTAADSGDGVSWSPAAKDYSFRVFGYEQPILGFSASASSPTVGPGQSVAFRADFSNSGSGDAAALWVNVTLPPELAYAGDDAASIGGVRTGTYSFAFANVVPGSYAFNVTTLAAGGVPDGTVVQTQFAFDGTDHLGAPLAASGMNVPVTMRNARLTMSLAASASDVNPGDRVILNATVTNLGSEWGAAVVVEGTVDSNATYISSTPPGSYNAGARTVTWSLGALGPTATTIVSWTVDVPIGTSDLAPIMSRARVQYQDTAAVPLPDETDAALTRVHAPIFAPVLRLNRIAAEAGTEVVASVDYNNTGSGPSLRAWINWTLGGNYRLIALVPVLPFSTTAAGFSISLSNVAPGPHSLSARLLVLRGLRDGLAMPFQVSMESTDGNGNTLPPTPLADSVELLAPSLSVSVAVANGTISVGSLFVLDVVIENVGRATATGWLNLTLPSAGTYVADNGTFVVTTSSGRVSWRIPSIAAGSRLHLGVTLRGDAAATATFRFVLDFTDSAESPPANALSNTIAVQFLGGGGGTSSWPWWLLAILVAIVLAIFLLVRARATIEEVFLVSHSGILLAHMSYTLRHDRDRDVLSGMLTAVQDFIRDSFVPTEEGALQSMNFGERKIIVRQGNASYLAIILKGRTPSSLPKKMDETLRKFEKAFPQASENVDGAILDGASDVLSKELLGR